MLDVRTTSRFKKDLKKVERQGREMAKLGHVIDKLKDGLPLEPHYRDHALTGNYVGHKECHLAPDWLLVYKIDAGFLILVRTGSHSELFG